MGLMRGLRQAWQTTESEADTYGGITDSEALLAAILQDCGPNK